MICPNCKADIPEGSTVCPDCSYQIEDAQKTPDTDVPDTDEVSEIPAVPIADIPSANTSEAVSENVSKKKSRKGLIIGIIAGVVVAAAVVVCLILFVFGSKTDGRYVCDYYSAFGIDFYLDVDGHDVQMVMEWDMDGDGTLSEDEQSITTGTIDFDGDVCTLTFDDTDPEDCAYDKKAKTITISDESSGIEIVFTKED